LGDYASSPTLTAASTVDKFSGAVVTETSTSGISFALPSPTNSTAGRIFQVSNSNTSTQSITVGGVTLAPGSSTLFRWDGSKWSPMTAATATNDWHLTGNSGTTPGTAAGQNYLGTTDEKDLVFGTKGKEKMRLFSYDTNEALGLGVTSVPGGIAAWSGATLFLGNTGNVVSSTGLDVIIDADKTSTNSEFRIRANGDWDPDAIDLLKVVETGNVGIGIGNTAPSNRLHVKAPSDPLKLEGLQTGASSDKILSVDGTGVVHQQAISSIGSISLSTGSTGNAPSWSTSTVSLGGSTQLNIPMASASSVTAGLISNSEWNTFNSKQAPITLTTTGTSGAATFVSNTLNIPTYTLPAATTSALGGVIIGNGLSVDGSGKISTVNNGTVTSVGLTMPSALSVANSPITGSGILNVTGAGTTNQYIKGDGTLGTYALSSLTDATIATPLSNQLLQYNGTKWVNWTPNYLTGNQSITLTGDVTGSGTTSFATTIANNAVNSAKILDGTIATVDLANNSVTAAKMSSGAATSGQVPIANGSGGVSYGNLPASSITGNNFTSTDLSITNGTGATLTNVTADIKANAVSYGKIQQVAIGSLIGNPTGIAANAQGITLGSGLSFSGTGPYSLINSGVTSFSAGTTGLTPSTASTGVVTLAGTLNIANGGTGATTANAALNNLLPTQTSNSGKVLTTDGTNASWVSSLSSNIYTANGTLTGNRTVTQDWNTLSFTANAQNAFSVDGSTFSVDAQSNRVGIGTSTPANTLEIVASSDPLKLNGLQPITTPSYLLGVDNSGVVKTVSASSSVPISSLLAATKANSIDNAGFSQTWNWNTLNGTQGLTLAASNITSGSILNIAATLGNINSATVGGLLNIANNASPSGISPAPLVMRVQANTNTGAGMVITDQGKVGIGTTSPSTLLHINGGTTSPAFRLVDGTEGLGKVLVSDNLGNASWSSSAIGWGLMGNALTDQTKNFLGTTDAQDLILKANNTEGFRVLQNGDSKVHGIITLGYGNGSLNTILGKNALTKNGGANSGGDKNTVIGALAMDEMGGSANGEQNVAVGYLAGHNLFNGGNNIFLGANALPIYPGLDNNNTLNIGNTIYGLNIGQGSSRQIGIATTNPTFTTPANTSSTIPTFGVDGTVNATNYTSPVKDYGITSSIAWNLSEGSSAKVALSTTAPTLSLSNLKAGMYGVLVITNNATTPQSIVSFGASSTAASASIPATSNKVINGGGGKVYLTASPSAVDIISFFFDGTYLYWTIGNNYN
jgi:hypothetical protein